MAESFEKRLDRFEHMLQETRDLVLQLNTKWNGGPGGWPQCQTTGKAIGDHEKRLRHIERRLWVAVGATAIIGPAITLGIQQILR